MWNPWLSILIVSVALVAVRGSAQELKLSGPELFDAYSFKTIGGVSGRFGQTDGVGTNALFASTSGLTADDAGNLYVVGDPSPDGKTVRKLTPDGVATTIAGKSGWSEVLDGIGSAARFRSPQSITLANDGNLYVADSRTIRKVTLDGTVTTLAGRGYVVDDIVDGVGTNARFHGAIGITHDGADNLYVVEHSAHVLRKVTLRGEVTTLAGMPLVRGTNDGVGIAARFDYPRAVTVGKDGNIYVADLGTVGKVRKVTPQGVVSTFATGFGLLTGIASDSLGNLYVVESHDYAIKKITPEGAVSRLMQRDGSPVRFILAFAIMVDEHNNIYVADAGDATIQKASQPEGVVELFLSLSGLDPFHGKIAVTETSTNLSEWSPLQMDLVSSGSPKRVIDTNSPSFSYRFYRSRFD